MTVQVRVDENRKPFFLDESLTLSRDDQTILTDAGRVTPLVYGTLMAKIAATGKWVPFTDETATNGTATARGVYIGRDIAAADIVAGDVEDVSILIGGGCKIDREQLVIENAKTLETVVAAGTLAARTVQDDLASLGIFIGESVDTTSFEN